MRRSFFLISIVCSIFSAAPAQDRPHVGPSASFNYDAVRSNSNPGQCGCFFLSGASFDAAIPINYRFSGVVDVGRQTASNINGGSRNISLVTVAVGPRIKLGSYNLQEHAHTTPFVQTLFGYSHGYNSFFPVGSGASSSSAFAFLAGGGIEVGVSRRISIRPVEVDYFYTQFANGSSNQQHNIRFSAGVVLR